MQDAARMPILAGAILFLLGLIEGALVQSFLNPPFSFYFFLLFYHQSR